MQGLPPDAAVWRKDNFPPATEFAALAVERLDALIALKTAKQGSRVRIPARAEIPRPGQDAQRKQMTTDPREIAAFFRARSGRKPERR